jgi:hypothetical protein
MQLKSAALLSVVLVVGCAHRNNKPRPLAPTTAASPEQIQALRDSYTKADPSARVGVVTAVLPSDNLAAVGDIPVGDLSNGDGFTFSDADNRPLTVGKVVAKTADAVHVKYETPEPTSRAPIVGDLAVHVRLVPPQR